MAQLSDLKSSIDLQFRSSLRMLDVAKDLNQLRLSMEAAGRQSEAAVLRSAVEQLVELSESLTDAARRSGRTLADAIRQSW